MIVVHMFFIKSLTINNGQAQRDASYMITRQVIQCCYKTEILFASFCQGGGGNITCGSIFF